MIINTVAASALPSLTPHVQLICKFCWLHLYNIACLHLFLSNPIVRTLVKPLSCLLSHSHWSAGPLLPCLPHACPRIATGSEDSSFWPHHQQLWDFQRSWPWAIGCSHHKASARICSSCRSGTLASWVGDSMVPQALPPWGTLIWLMSLTSTMCDLWQKWSGWVCVCVRGGSFMHMHMYVSAHD